MKLLFWVILLFVCYTYFGYPLFLYILSLFCEKPVRKWEKGFHPTVSVVIAARNEEENIERRIRNIWDQDYPKEKLELIIVSDGSVDKTEDIVTRMIKEAEKLTPECCRSLKLIPNRRSRGKPSSINEGVSAAKGKFVVFADCRQRFSRNAIQQLINNFNDEKVGCVSGELVLEETLGNSIQAEMGAYWNFEKWLRKVESRTGSVPGATGAIYAIRKNLFHPLPERALLDDVLIPLRISMQGYRTIFDSEAVAYDTVSRDFDAEKKRKIRTLAGNWQLLILEPALLNPLKNSLYLRFLSHKIFRLLIPYCLVTLLVVALFLMDVYSILLLIAVVLFLLISALPQLHGPLSVISKLTRVFRSVIFLNYFALLAPFKLVLTPKKLW